MNTKNNTDLRCYNRLNDRAGLSYFNSSVTIDTSVTVKLSPSFGRYQEACP